MVYLLINIDALISQKTLFNQYSVAKTICIKTCIHSLCFSFLHMPSYTLLKESDQNFALPMKPIKIPLNVIKLTKKTVYFLASYGRRGPNCIYTPSLP